MHVLIQIALAAAAVLVVTWLAVSFLSPSPRRRALEWFGATAMYVALLGLFSRGLHDAVVDGSWLRMFAFGFLVTIFGIGLVISTVRTIRALVGRSDTAHSGATH